MEKLFKVCESPLCTSKIWYDGYKFETGRFCDKYCKEDYNLSRGRSDAEKEHLQCMLDTKYLKVRKQRSDSNYQFVNNKLATN